MNPCDIPCIINNFNRLGFLQKLVSSLLEMNTRRIIILDNASTYAPLLQWYAKQKDKRIHIRRLGRNYGSQALWLQPDKGLLTLPFIYTDPDIVPDDDCPKDLNAFLLKTWEQCSDKLISSWDGKRPQKIGPGLKVSDIPDCYALKGQVLAWEERHAGADKLQAECNGVKLYDVALDTTYALYVGYAFPFGLSAVRTGEPFLVKHLSWYADSAHPTAEELYYERTANKRVTNWGVTKCYSDAVNRLYAETQKKQDKQEKVDNMAKQTARQKAEEERKKQEGQKKQFRTWIEKSSLSPKKNVPPVPISEYDKIPMSIDLAPYADFYQGIVQDVLAAKNGDDVHIVDIGVRYGCSSRIFRDALGDKQNAQLTLIDPVITQEAEQLASDTRIALLQRKGEDAGRYFQDNSIDILHIDCDCDGTHPYELSFEPLLAFWHKLRPDARVIIHDATDHFPGVQRLVRELEASGWEATRCKPRVECPIAAPVVLTRKETGMSQSKASYPPLTAVIPVIQEKWLGPLLGAIVKMKVKPEEIIVIDNANGAVRELAGRYEKKLNIRYLAQKKNIGVNASWNLGLAESKTEWVTILNDDLALPPQFFESIQSAIQTFPRAGFIIPSTLVPKTVGKRFPTWEIGLPADVKSSNELPEAVNVPRRDGGWAMTVKKSLVEPISSELFTFAGDDAIFKQITDKGYWALRLLNTSVFHYVGISLDRAMRDKLKLPSLEHDLGKWGEIVKGR
jgi:glycosyltransferase involved in cell wall biosynthesis